MEKKLDFLIKAHASQAINSTQTHEPQNVSLNKVQTKEEPNTIKESRNDILEEYVMVPKKLWEEIVKKVEALERRILNLS
ncbi:MAG: hypothetical protein QXE78_03955 [Nitrososphaeria archaeon]